MTTKPEGNNISEWAEDIYEKVAQQTDDYFIYIIGAMRFIQTSAQRKLANKVWRKFHPDLPIPVTEVKSVVRQGELR